MVTRNVSFETKILIISKCRYPRNIYIYKLDAYGFDTNSLHLIRSFFKDRLNRVKLNDVTSEWKSMERGCPQGSSFGPLLWNIFQNDMAFHVTKSNLTMYADDHQLYTTGKDHNTVGDILQTEAQKALDWYKNNHLLANPEKYQSEGCR